MDVYPKTAHLNEGGHFYTRIKAGNCMGCVTSLIVTSGGTYGVLAGNWLPLSCNPGGTPGIVQAVCQAQERGQGPTG